MAVVRDWQTPLEESLERMLGKAKPSADELDQVRNSLAMLDPGTEGAVRVRQHLEDSFQQLEQKYQEAVRYLESTKTGKEAELAASRLSALGAYKDAPAKAAEARRKVEEFRLQQLEKDYQEAVRSLESAKTRAETDRAVARLKDLGNYKDIAAKIAEGEQKAETLRVQEAEQEARRLAAAKKRKAFTLAAAVVLVGAVIVFFVIQGMNRQKRINEYKAQVQTMISAKQEAEVGGPLGELASMGVSADELYPLSEAALESLALREGPDAAYALLAELGKSDRPVVRSSSFGSWVLEQCAAENLSAEQRWAFARAYLKPVEDKTDVSESALGSAYEAYLLSETDRTDKRSAAEWDAWAGEMRPYMSLMPADPETALRLAYRMADEGADLKSAFPDGILINLPVGATARAVNKAIIQGAETPPLPDTTRLLPVLIREKITRNMYYETHSTEKKLKSDIESLQAEDGHYSVCLLPGDLMSIPEECRAKTFAECTSWIVMQQSYYLAGWTYTTTTYSTSKYSISTSLGSGTTSDYRGNYSAMDLVLVCDAKAPDHLAVIHLSHDTPIIGDKSWYNTHKYDLTSSLYSEENCFGKHDSTALRTEYENTMQISGNLNLLLLLLRSDTEQTGE